MVVFGCSAYIYNSVKANDKKYKKKTIFNWAYHPPTSRNGTIMCCKIVPDIFCDQEIQGEAKRKAEQES